MKTEATIRRNRILLIALAVLLVLALAVSAVFFARYLEEKRLDEHRVELLAELDAREGEYDTQSIVLSDTTKEKANALAERFGAKLRITKNGKFATLTLPEGVTVRDVLADKENRKYLDEMAPDFMASVSDVEELTEEKYVRQPARPNYTITDSGYAQQTYLDYLNIKSTWNSYRGNGVTVAVIDTGIDTDHPEFAGRISEYSYNATEDKIVKDYENDWSLIEDEQGHGTAVAGVIAAAMDGNGTVGIAPQVNILVIKAECDENGRFRRTSDLVFGLYYAIERDVAVVNMSFGSYDPSNPFAAPALLAKDSDILCVASAGNDTTTELNYPAADENVIGVGALAADSWELATYSNYGENTNVVAPGTVYTTKVGGIYDTINGTSFSSPIVAATLALIKSNYTYKYVTNDAIIELLYASCYDLGDLGPDWYFGYGAVDVNALLMEEKGTVTFNMLTDELENTTQKFVRSHTLQNIPEPERLYAIFDGWYYDIECTEEYNLYEDAFHTDLTLYANWVNEDDGVPYTYVTLDDGTIEIRSYTGRRRYITIPDTIEGKTVSSIGEFAFQGESRLRQVNLPRNLKRIRDYAFDGCNNLVSIVLPNTVEYVGTAAFKDNTRLSTVGIPADGSLKTIGDFAFQNCGKLCTIELPVALESVNGSAFFGATNLTSIKISAKNSFFRSMDGLLFNKTASTLVAYPAGKGNTYTVPTGVRTIGDYAFGYAKLKTVNLDGVTSIGESAFAYSRLEAVTIPDSVVEMGDKAFSNSGYLETVTLGSGIRSIPKKTFEECDALSKIEIPKGVREIGKEAFYRAGLVTLTFEDNSELCSIGQAAFYDCPIAKVSFPNSLLKIGDSAFEHMFFGPYLSEITFGESLQSIGEYAFKHSAASMVTLPENLNKLGDGAFASCHNLENIFVDDNNSTYIDVDGVVYNPEKTVIVEYPAGSARTAYTIEPTATEVGNCAFYGSWNLKKVKLPSTLVTVGEYGFYDCEGITGYTLPESLTYIERYAFSKNYSLGADWRSLYIPDNVIQISNYAFAEDFNLRCINLNDTSKLPRISFAAFAMTGINDFRVPPNVSTIAQYAFEGCTNLWSITFAENSKLESISAYMFRGCDSIGSITFENGTALTSIDAHGLEGMKMLTSVDFGDAKLTDIDNYAFRYCSNLSTLNLPEGVVNIGRFAFYKCSSISELALPTTVEHIGSYAFHGTNNCNLYFKADSLPFYLDESWDNGLGGYYTGVSEVKVEGDYKIATLASGKKAIVEYLGTEKNIDLTTLNIGEITTISGYAFAGKGIESIILPSALTQIDRYAFADNRELQSIAIPENVQYIASYAFYNTGIESLTFAGNNVKVIERYAFAYTENLNAVTIPASVETLGSYVFQKSGISSLTFEEGTALTEIPKGAFSGTKLTSVIIPDSVTLIDDGAFRDCTALASLTLGAGENLRLMSNVFYNTGLTAVHIPANVEYVGEYCFVGLRNLTAFTVDSENPNYKTIDGLLYSKDGRKIIAAPAGIEGTIHVPQSTEVIGFGAFENSKATSIVFNPASNILSFGYRAFYNAGNLTEINVPATVVTIDYYAFAQCSKLETVTFEEGTRLTGIYEGAFYGCTSLKNITIPDSIVEISDYAFYGCQNITTIPISEMNELKGIYSYAFAYTGLRGELTTPATLIEIGEYAFMGTKLTKVTIPDDNKEQLFIGIGAFYECNEMTEIAVPFIGASYEDGDITWVGYIFGAGGYEANSTYVPESLKTVTITEGITRLRTGAFYGLTSLEVINVPHSVMGIYEHVFDGPYNQTTYKYEIVTAEYELTNTITPYTLDKHGNEQESSFFGDSFVGPGLTGDLKLANSVTSLNVKDCSDLASIKMPDGVTGIEGRWFFNCTGLAKVTFGESSQLTSIGDYAFSSCHSLTSINIPDGVTRIGDYAFDLCEGLTSITIPTGVTSIGDGAFSGCSHLYEIINKSALPLTIGSRDYGNIAQNAKVIVNADGTKQFKGDDNFVFINTSDGFRFSYHDGQYQLISYFGNEDTVVLPLTCNGNTYSISRMKGVRNVIIPDGMTSIDDEAFKDCFNLKSITIPESVTRIGDSAFSGCSSLASIEIPDSVTSIGDEAFGGCDNLVSIEIPHGVTSIGKWAFSGCSGLTSIEIPHGVTRIGDNVFYGCNNLTSVHMPEGVTSIGKWAFSGCVSLTGIEIPDSVMSIGQSAFSRCIGLTSITIPNGVTSIGERAFQNCTALTNLEIPDGVTSIGQDAFFGSGIQTLIFSESNPLFKFVGGVLYDGSMTKILWVSDTVEGITVAAGIKDIASTFQGKTRLKSVAFNSGSSLTSIGTSAFSGCSSLASIEIPDSVTSIGNEAFFGCSSLTSIKIPDGVTSIGDQAFGGCISLMSITIPDGVTSIGQSAFSSCVSFTSITIPDGVTNIEQSAFSGCSGLMSITIPDGVMSIGDAAFRRCSSLMSVTIPESVTSIGDYAFDGCDRLYEIVNKSALPLTIGGSDYGYIAQNALVIIGADGAKQFKDDENCALIDTSDGFRFLYYNGEYQLIAYLGNEDTVTLPLTCNGNAYLLKNGFLGVRNVIIPQGVTSIGYEAFYDCRRLTSIVIPEGVTSIGARAFMNCRSLTSVEMPSSVTSIGYSAFSSCTALTGIEIPYGVTSIEWGTFAHCNSLTSIVIPEGVTSIGNQAFRNAEKLMSIEVPNSVTNIEGQVFFGTAYYNDPDHWKNGCLFIGKHLFKVSADASFVVATGTIARDAFEESYGLKKLTIGGYKPGMLSQLSNLETLVLNELPTKPIYRYFGYNGENIPLTLKTIVLKSGCDVQDVRLLDYITGVTIYVEDEKTDCPWDYDYKGWNNGNKVYYGDEWVTASFCDENGLLTEEQYRTSQVIRPPYVANIKTAEKERTFLGWDFDGDGLVDSLPATMITDVNAMAVFAETEATYKIEFLDKDGKAVLHTYTLPYGKTIPAPAQPTKKGYSFGGWIGFTDGMTVTSDRVIQSKWTHSGAGHSYADAVIPPTCMEQGYSLHTCSICDESYKTDITEATGHTFGEWIVDLNATCTENGERHRACACGETETETVFAEGHSFVVTSLAESTCEKHGKASYECSVCHETAEEDLPLSAHTYERQYAPKSFIDWLIENLSDVFYGYEENQGFYEQCTVCKHIATAEEAASFGASAQGVCIHEAGEWTLAKRPTSSSYGVETCSCSKCGEVLNARATEKLPYTAGDINGDDKVNVNDLVRLAQKQAGWSVEVVEEALDVNGDGKRNVNDLVRLAQYLAGWEVEIF